MEDFEFITQEEVDQFDGRECFVPQANKLLNEKAQNGVTTLTKRGQIQCQVLPTAPNHMNPTDEVFYFGRKINPKAAECDHVMTAHGGTNGFKFEMFDRCAYCLKCGILLETKEK